MKQQQGRGGEGAPTAAVSEHSVTAEQLEAVPWMEAGKRVRKKSNSLQATRLWVFYTFLSFIS